MAGFKTHITTSTVLGIGYGVAAKFYLDVPLPTCILASGLCSVAGMMPDLDSGPGRPLRESMAFAAAVVPMMFLDRFHDSMSLETMILIGGAMYLFIRFGVAAMLRKYTVHRGMFHSLPAALIAGEIAFLVFSSEELDLRYFIAAAVVLGFMSHLVLDEIWSIEWHRGRIRFKSSFGTAMKLWGDSMWANVSTYMKVIVLTFLAFNDPTWIDHLRSPSDQQPQIAERILQRLGWQGNPPPTASINGTPADTTQQK